MSIDDDWERHSQDKNIMTIGEIIRDIRKEKGLTQSELADLAKTSVHTVTSYELDKITPWRNLQNILEAMGYEIEILVVEMSGNRALDGGEK